MKSIFVSYVYEDHKFLNKMRKWEERGLVEGCTFTFETEDKRQEGEKAIHNYLKEKIRGSAFFLVLIGDNTHNHNWIKKEVELANSFHKKILCMRIPNTHGKKPGILGKFKELEFNPNQIMKEIK